MRFRLRFLIAGGIAGLVILFSFIWTQPDGLLHIVFCNVGQGDAAYIRFPDGRDMLMDGGSENGRVLTCLGRHMPFWDRHLTIVAMSHPQADHMGGLPEVFKRFTVDYFLRSDVANATDVYNQLMAVVTQKRVPVKYLTTGDQITIGATSLSVLWPSSHQIELAGDQRATAQVSPLSQVATGSSTLQLNDFCLVILIQYGNFDALFTGDADSRVEANYSGLQVFRKPVEVLKVPHHGSKTGMTKDFVGWVRPELAVISVGKNSYGQPSKEAVGMLQSVNSRILRTDKNGDVEVVSNGVNWSVIH